MDSIRATPYEYELLGLLADKLKKAQDYATSAYGEFGVDVSPALNLLGIPAVQQTMERVAYGEPLTTGKGMTTQVRPEVMEAALTLLPVQGGASRAAKAVDPVVQKYGPKLEQSLLPALEAAYNRGGLTREMVEAMGNRTVSPLTVYHGSPAKFERFDPTKIGSGEGAQAYGYGHYVAESPDVARRYQMGLTQANGEEVLYKNKPLADLYSQIENKSMKLSGKAADIENQKLQLVEHMMLDKPPQELIPYAKETGFDQSVIDWLEKDVAKNTQIPGAFYEIDLPDEQIARMIDYDKSFSDQTEYVKQKIQEALELRKKQTGGYGLFDPLEKSSIKDILGTIGEGRLKDVGIPGIRYLDEGSRGIGEGTSNFVVFPGNEDLLTILKRNGGLLGP